MDTSSSLLHDLSVCVREKEKERERECVCVCEYVYVCVCVCVCRVTDLIRSWSFTFFATNDNAAPVRSETAENFLWDRDRVIRFGFGLGQC